MALTPKMWSFGCFSRMAKVLYKVKVSPPSLGQNSAFLSILQHLWYGHSLPNLAAAVLCWVSPYIYTHTFQLLGSPSIAQASPVPCHTNSSPLGSTEHETPILPWTSPQEEGRKSVRAEHQGKCEPHLT